MLSQLQYLITHEIFVIMLVFCRLGAMFIILPAFGETYISPRFRLLIALSVSLIMATPLSVYITPYSGNVTQLLLLIMIEIIVGFFLGFIMRVIFNIFLLAGTFITYLTGFANAQLFNPILQGQGGLHAALLTLSGIAVLLATDLHHYSFVALMDSYKIFPVGVFLLLGDFSEKIMLTMTDSFKIGFQLSMPFVLMTIVFYTLMGIMSRLMPQLQIFFLSLPLQILGGALIFIGVITAMLSIGITAYENLLFEFIEADL